MRAFDTNVLTRCLVGDDPTQEALARGAIGACTPEAPGFLGRDVPLELAWVLRSTCRMARDRVGDAMEGVLSANAFAVGRAADATRALDGHRAGEAEFADLTILAAAR